jgi:hypothetical protein
VGEGSPRGREDAGRDRLTVETPVERLERWEDFGAIWRTLAVSDDLAVVQLCTCHGEPVDRLESSDRALIEYVRARPRSDD